MPPNLVLDACVLMSGVLRPLLLKLANENWFDPIWSDRIGAEWRHNAARLWPIKSEVLEQAWHEMQLAFPAANSTLWSNHHLRADTILPPLRDSDPKDWHVIMSGIQAKQRQPERDVTVVTWNIKDFRRSELRQHGLNLIDPDRLLSLWWATQPRELEDRLNQVINSLIQSGRREPESMAAFLKRERLYRFAKLYQSSRQPTL